MSRLNLRAAFALGLDSPISAQHIFTDRVSEIAAFDRSLATLGAHLDAAEVSPVTDRRMPRRNVLVYYGVGGIGKTTLSAELERRFLGENGRSRAVTRVDFAESASHDVESYVLRLRAGLGARYGQAEGEIERGLRLTTQSGYPGGKIWCWTARAYRCAAQADHDGHSAAVAELAHITVELGGNRFWHQIAAWWAPDRVAPSSSAFDSSDFADIDWIDGTSAARERWISAHSTREGLR